MAKTFPRSDASKPATASSTWPSTGRRTAPTSRLNSSRRWSRTVATFLQSTTLKGLFCLCQLVTIETLLSFCLYNYVKGILNVTSTLKISIILIFALLIKNYNLNVFSHISHVLDILFTTRSSRKVLTRTALPSIPWRSSASFSRPWTASKSTNRMSSAARRFTMQLLEELRSPVFFCFRLENLSYLTIRL